MIDLKVHEDGNRIFVSLKPGIYPLDVIFSAAYVFMDRAYVIIDGNPASEITVELRPKDGKTDTEKLGGEFANELLNYSVYKIQSEKNSAIRQAIIQRALMTNDPDVMLEAEEVSGSGSPIDDPEGIAIPWEEKYGGKSKDAGDKKR
jgi:His-Xaa-Ser system protein HxsD